MAIPYVTPSQLEQLNTQTEQLDELVTEIEEGGSSSAGKFVIDITDLYFTESGQEIELGNAQEFLNALADGSLIIIKNSTIQTPDENKHILFTRDIYSYDQISNIMEFGGSYLFDEIDDDYVCENLWVNHLNMNQPGFGHSWELQILVVSISNGSGNDIYTISVVHGEEEESLPKFIFKYVYYEGGEEE